MHAPVLEILAVISATPRISYHLYVGLREIDPSRSSADTAGTVAIGSKLVILLSAVSAVGLVAAWPLFSLIENQIPATSSVHPCLPEIVVLRSKFPFTLVHGIKKLLGLDHIEQLVHHLGREPKVCDF